MKFYLIVCFLLLLIAPIQVESKEDFFTPCYSLLTGDGVLLNYGENLRSILLENSSLSVKGYNFLMLKIPSFEKEWLVAIHGSRIFGYSVISITPNKSIYSQVVQNYHYKADRKLRRDYNKEIYSKDVIVEENERTIASNIAEQIIKICTELIIHTKLCEEGDQRVLDGTRYILSFEEGICAAVVSPNKKSKIGKFILLGELLYEYTLSNSQQNDDLEQQIQKLTLELSEE